MTKLIPVVVISMILAVISHKRSDFSHSRERYRRKECIFYTIMAVVMILFVGLRTRYNDTGTYRYGYEMMNPVGSVIDSVTNWALGANPGFELVNGILKMLGVSTQGFLLLYAAVTNGIYLWFLRKYSNNIWLTIFLFIAIGCFTFTLAAIKQCVAVAFCLLGVDQLLDKRTDNPYFYFVMWVVIASFFHPYALMFLAVPFLMFRPWRKKTYWTLAVFGAAGLMLQFLFSTIVDVTTILGEEYDVSSFSGEGVNPFRLAVCAVPILLSFVARKLIAQMDEKRERMYFLFTNLSILNAEIMFVALFGTANYFARLANYFLIFQALSIPWLFQFFEKRSRKLLTVTAVICYCCYFVYDNAINKLFDADYASVSLLEYLRSLL